MGGNSLPGPSLGIGGASKGSAGRGATKPNRAASSNPSEVEPPKPRGSRLDQKIAEGKIPDLVHSRINIRNGKVDEKSSGLEYALGKHGGVEKPNKSQFSISRDEIVELLKSESVVKSPVRISETSGNYIREVDVGFKVGNIAENLGGKPTNYVTVITDKYGNLVNTFPGKLTFGSE